MVDPITTLSEAGGKARAILLLAKTQLTPETWRQGGEAVADDCCCAFIALFRATVGGSDKAVKLAERALYQATGSTSIVDWNDTPGRTLDEIHAAFDRAIAVCV